MERLPLLTTVTEATKRYRDQFASLLRVIALPALAYALLLYAWREAFSENLVVSTLVWIPLGLPLTLAAISCHRVLLLGSESVPTLGASGTSARDWRFIGMAALLFVITNMVLQVPVMMAFFSLESLKPYLTTLSSDTIQTIGRIAALPALYIACRLAICLPAIATDHPLRMRQAWALTRGHGMRLLLLIGIAPWLLHLAQRLLADMIYANTDFFIASRVVFWLFLPLEIALLSICYRRLSQTAA